MLVILINSFLHFQASAQLLEKLQISSYFHSLISHFASLGPVARLYLLKTGTLNRQLQIFFNNSSGTNNS